MAAATSVLSSDDLFERAAALGVRKVHAVWCAVRAAKHQAPWTAVAMSHDGRLRAVTHAWTPDDATVSALRELLAVLPS